MTRIEGDLAACAGLVERGDPDRFAAAMAAPLEARARLLPLYAFNLEVARAPWVASEPMIAEMRLQWWRDVLEEIAGGGPVRRHEVTTPLAAVLPPASARALDGMIEARRWDIYRDAFEDDAALRAYLRDTGGALMQAAVAVLGGDAPGAGDIGTASAVAGFLQAVPELEARGRIPLVDGRPEGVTALARWGLERLAAGRKAGANRAARPALIAAWLAGPILKQAASDPARVAEGQLVVSDATRRGRLLWAGLTGRV